MFFLKICQGVKLNPRSDHVMWTVVEYAWHYATMASNNYILFEEKKGAGRAKVMVLTSDSR